MTPMTLDRKDRAWLDDHAHEWVDAGLITTGQAEAIVEFEREPTVPLRLPLLAEAASYLGSVLALMGGAAAVGPNWDELGLFGQLGVGLAVALVGFLAGRWLMRLGEAGTARLGGLVWVVGTGGVGIAVVAIMAEIDPRDEAWIPLIAGLPVAAIGLGLWRNLDRPLQLLTAAAGGGMMLAGATELTDAPSVVPAALLLAFGVSVALAAAVHRLAPRLIGLSLGSFSAFTGGLVLMDVNEHLGLFVALAVAVSVVVFALQQRLVALLVPGVIGSLIATQGLLATTFTGAVSSLIVTTIGLVIVVVAVDRTRRGRLTDSSSAAR